MKVTNSRLKVKYILLYAMLAGMSNMALASDDAYLRALEAEASNLSADNASGTTVDADASEKAKEQAAAEVKINTRKAEYETALKQQLPNTFTIYLRLTPEQKAMVVETYFANDQKIAASSRQIFDFYLFDRKK